MLRVAFRIVIACLLVVALAAFSLSFRQPRLDRDWMQDQSKMPEATVQGELVTIKNVRNFRYRSVSDWNADWYEATYDLAKIVRAYFVVEPFSEFEGAAHTFVSFEFDNDQYVAISIELRKEKGESFSPFRGLLREYELMYVVGDERDLIELRTNHRKDDVYLFPIRTTKERLKRYFLDLVERMNKLRTKPEFYNTLTSSCTTNLADHLRKISPKDVPRFDYRLYLPGYSGELAYELGLVDFEGSFEEAQRRFQIKDRAQSAAGANDFSTQIRTPSSQ